MRIFEDIIQGSPAWHDLRRGRPTASGFDRILTAKTMKPSAQMHDYAADLAADVAELNPNWFSESPRNKPPNAAMEAGKEREPEARKWLEMEKDCSVKQVGFLLHDNSLWGCSPDGLLVDDQGELAGGLELKCPQLNTQARYVLANEMPPEYKAQVHGSLIVSGLPSWLFLSYAPGLAPLLLEVRRDDYTKRLEEALVAFTDLYDKTLQNLLGYGVQEAMRRLHPEPQGVC